jgi:hypothetical protein
MELFLLDPATRGKSERKVAEGWYGGRALRRRIFFFILPLARRINAQGGEECTEDCVCDLGRCWELNHVSFSATYRVQLVL